MSTTTKYLVTPFGKAKWIDLLTPKVFGGAAPTPQDPGRYQLVLMLDPDSTQTQQFLEDFANKSDQLFQDKLEEMGGSGAKKYDDGFLPVMDDTDQDGKPTGLLCVKMAVRAGGVRKDGTPWSHRIPIKDALGKTYKFNEGEEPGYGTDCRASFEPFLYPVQGTKMWRVSARLRSVQIRDLVVPSRGADGDFAGVEVEAEEFE